MKKLKLSLLLIVTSVTCVLIYRSFSTKECDKVVILDDGKVINCKWVNSYASGFSNIRKCDNTDFQIETNNIKQVINK
jgi:hypothetical protein